MVKLVQQKVMLPPQKKSIPQNYVEYIFLPMQRYKTAAYFCRTLVEFYGNMCLKRKQLLPETQKPVHRIAVVNFTFSQI